MIWQYKTFKRLMLPIIPVLHFVPGRLIRSRFNEVSGRTIGPAKFYIWMHRLRDEGLVVVQESQDSDGKILLFRKP
jgi:DNA-binding PadR family transcriptional regulator